MDHWRNGEERGTEREGDGAARGLGESRGVAQWGGGKGTRPINTGRGEGGGQSKERGAFQCCAEKESEKMRGGGCEGECRCGSNVKNEHRNDKAATEPMTRRYSDGKQKPEQRELTEDTVHPGYLVGGGGAGFYGNGKGGGEETQWHRRRGCGCGVGP